MTDGEVRVREQPSSRLSWPIFWSPQAPIDLFAEPSATATPVAVHRRVLRRGEVPGSPIRKRTSQRLPTRPGTTSEPVAVAERQTDIP